MNILVCEILPRIVYKLVDEFMACYHVGRFFYPAGIRFIAVEDGFDSFRDDLELYLKRYANRYASFLGAQRHEKRFNRNKVTSVSVPYGYLSEITLIPSQTASSL